MPDGVKALSRRVAGVEIQRLADGSVSCRVQTTADTVDQYGGVIIPHIGPGDTIYRMVVSFGNRPAIGRAYFQLAGQNGNVRWLWYASRHPIAEGRHTVVFRPGEPAGPFEIHPTSSPSIEEAERIQFYVRPAVPGAAIGFVIHTLEKAGSDLPHSGRGASRGME